MSEHIRAAWHSACAKAETKGTTPPSWERFAAHYAGVASGDITASRRIWGSAIADDAASLANGDGSLWQV